MKILELSTAIKKTRKPINLYKITINLTIFYISFLIPQNGFQKASIKSFKAPIIITTITIIIKNSSNNINNNNKDNLGFTRTFTAPQYNGF